MVSSNKFASADSSPHPYRRPHSARGGLCTSVSCSMKWSQNLTAALLGWQYPDSGRLSASCTGFLPLGRAGLEKTSQCLSPSRKHQMGVLGKQSHGPWKKSVSWEFKMSGNTDLLSPWPRGVPSYHNEMKIQSFSGGYLYFTTNCVISN